MFKLNDLQFGMCKLKLQLLFGIVLLLCHCRQLKGEQEGNDHYSSSEGSERIHHSHILHRSQNYRYQYTKHRL